MSVAGWLALLALAQQVPLEESDDFRRTVIGDTGWRLDEGTEEGEYVCRPVRALDGDYAEIKMNYDIADPAIWLSLDEPPRAVPVDPDVIEPMTTPPSFRLSVNGLAAASPSAWRVSKDLAPGRARYVHTMRLGVDHSTAILGGKAWRLSDDEGFALRVEDGAFAPIGAALNECVDRELQRFGLDPAVYRANQAHPAIDVLVFNSGDYPSRALRQELEGTARAMLTVDARGRVSNCIIVQTSGHALLDEATCKVMTRRMRFDEGAEGRPYLAMAVKWQLG